MSIAIVGDWHGNLPFAEKVIRTATMHGATRILHVGDFGVWYPYTFPKYVSDLAGMYGAEVYFIDGNHEDHVYLQSKNPDPIGFVQLAEHVHYITRGTIWEWEGLSFLGLGGAVSVDKSWRKEGISWFPQEVINDQDVMRATRIPRVDVMITHDCPDGVDIPGISDNPYGFPQEDLDASEEHRKILGSVVDSVKPSLLYHGHFHTRYSAMRGETRITGLGDDRGSVSDNVVYLTGPYGSDI